MEDIIRDIQTKIQQNRFPNEASISQGIVLRIIRALGWNVDDIDVVWPEFSTGTQRADFALCHPAGKPLVLIEVKQSGTMNVQAEEQLAAYAYREGVPLVILTSGQDWHFYAPYGPGQFSDRRIYRLDLLERTPEEADDRFRRYLSFSAWTSGQANLAVQEDLREMLSKQETRRKLPEAWEALLSEPDPQLVELLTAQLEKQTGSEPPKGEVVAFLRSHAVNPVPLSRPSQPSSVRSRRPSPKAPQPRIAPTSGGRTRNTNSDASIRLWIEDEEVPVVSHRDRFVKVLEHLASKDEQILQRLHDIAPAGRRPTVATSPEALYPRNPEFASARPNAWRQLSSAPGWFVDVNKSGGSMIEFIEAACMLAGLKLGKEIRLD